LKYLSFIPLTAAAPFGLPLIVTLDVVTQFFYAGPRTFVMVMATATTTAALSCHHEKNRSDGNYP
jgi:hypothetical protein